MNTPQLSEWVQDARQRTRCLIDDLTDEQLIGPQLAIVNPLLWEIGHVAWFQEKWVLRHACGEAPIQDDADTLYDSAAIPHDTRWDLWLRSRRDTLAYMSEVEKRVLDRLHMGSLDDSLRYFVLLTIFHEDMHTEAFTYTRQTLGYPMPPLTIGFPAGDLGMFRRGLIGGPLSGDVEVPGGLFQLGARPEDGFVFDNEKWAHPVEIEAFGIARAPVTQQEFAAFVDDGGYRRRELWSDAGWKWCFRNNAAHPVYWSKQAIWVRRDFNRLVPLEPHQPVIHVNWFEADAYCRWAKRRLPTEAEWELAASGFEKRRYPWGYNEPDLTRAALDDFFMCCADVVNFESGDSWCGCRQMIGNVWEWTASDFLPYPAFVADPYKEYSLPWFGTHKVLRGGCWVTRGRLLRNTWRNFYTPDRRDVWAGFRTCAL
jgi:iron(II)-dependent oxidoreductase